MAFYDLLLLMRQRSGRIISTGIMKAYGPNPIRGDCQKWQFGNDNGQLTKTDRPTSWQWAGS